MRELKVGDWWLMPYGFGVYKWYIWDMTDKRVCIGKKTWLVSCSEWVSKESFLERAEFYCAGKRRWWWRFLPWRDCVVPFSEN